MSGEPFYFICFFTVLLTYPPSTNIFQMLKSQYETSMSKQTVFEKNYTLMSKYSLRAKAIISEEVRIKSSNW